MHTIKINWFFLLATVIFTGVATYIQLEDVWLHNQPLTIDHVIQLALLLGALICGHNVIPQLRRGNIVTGFVLVLCCISCTFLVVSESAGRTAKVQYANMAKAEAVHDQYTSTKDQLKQARIERKAIETKFASECASGNGARCKGYKVNLDQKDDDIRLLQARLELLQLPMPADPKVEYMTDLLGLFLSAPEALIKKALSLLYPLAKVGSLELLILVSAGMSFQHQYTPLKQIEESVVEGGELEVVTPLLTGPTSPVLDLLAKVPRPPTNNELAEMLGISPGYASKLVSALVAQGVVQRDQVGREVYISIVNKH